MAGTILTAIDLEPAISRQPLTIAPTACVVEAITLMSAGGTNCSFSCEINAEAELILAHAQSSCVLVVENNQLMGIITERDLVRLSSQGINLAGLTISEVMVSPVLTLEASEFTNLFVPLNLFQRHHIRHLPLVNKQGTVLGLITPESLRQLLRPIDLLHLRVASEVMTTEVIHTQPTATIFEVTQLMTANRVSSVVIVIANEQRLIPVGMITERDIVQFLALELDFSTIQAQTVMSTPVFSVGGDISLWSVRMLMQERQINRVVVTDEENSLLGIVTQTSLLNVLNPMEIYRMVETLEEKVSRLESEKLELLQTRNKQLERQVTERTTALEVQIERERLLTKTSTQIRSSLNLQEILSTTVTEVRKFLKCDRILVYQFQPDWSGIVVAESVGEGWAASIAHCIEDTCFQQQIIEMFSSGQTIAIDNIHKTGYAECHVQLLERYQVKANLVVPILVSGQLWGLLIGHHCADYRHWDTTDLTLLDKIAIQLAIAIQHATAHQKAQTELAERQKAEAALREKEEFLRGIYEGIEQAVFTIDVLENGEFRFLTFNPACERLTGMLTQEMQGKSPKTAIKQNYTDCVQAGVPICYEESIFFQGSITWWITTLTPIKDASDRIYRIVGTSTPITERKQTELALLQSQSRLAEAQRVAKIGNWEFDIETEKITWSAELFRILRRDPSLGEPTYVENLQLYHPEDAEKLHQAVERTIYQGESYQLQLRALQPDGSFRFVEVIARAELNDQGMIKRLFGTVQDVNVRVQTEKALEQLNQELEIKVEERTAALQEMNTAMQNAVEGISRLDTQGYYSSINPSYAHTCGYEPDEMIGMMWQQTVHPEDIAYMEAAYYQMLKMGKVEAEARGIRKDGTVFYKQVTMISTYNKQGEFIGNHCFMKDVSERKRLEQEQNRLIAMLEASTDYIGMANADGNILWHNREFGKLLGLDSDASVKDRRISDYHPQWALNLVLEEGLPGAIANGTWVGETALLNAQGEEIPVSQLLIAHKSPQGVVEFFSTIIRDIRVRKEYEQRLERSNAELLRATRLKDEFLANMSHELRTPLNAILGLSESLQEEVFGNLNERQKKSISTIERSGRHLLELINDILDVSKIEAGKVELDMTSVSVLQLCNSSLAFVKQQAMQKNLQLKTTFQEDLGEIIVDERRMRQVLINLLMNAVKFTPAGGQVILDVGLEYLEVYRSDESCPPDQPNFLYSLYFSIIDTGIGIAATDIDKLFQPFMQIDSSLNRKYAGTGLGLTLVRQIVELHGATITVNSQLDQGSCFTVRLPHIPRRTVSPKPQTSLGSSVMQFAATMENLQQTDVTPEPVIKQPVILLAEDNSDNIETFCAYLEACGYRLILANNGHQAIAQATTQTPNLILMDIQMPDMDGLEAIRQIRANPQLVSMPIIALTALAMPGDKEKCLQAGANEYLSKPVKLKQMANMIQKLLTGII
ncbi:PAS domain S-box protein [Anabaena cylindrica FACHB-243]|uniref:Circadian input-output histidine kinase CikA n=1 Tax=Anabaena cylindrica (strain ATCC 27899 / PCC 7122) TaxID=272123 RepID=K9ZBX0_ANACC|nr:MULTISPECIES: PAS domain S-box protein [Anabaena]AFZ56688.1 multi-sensor hybrid histidine kinase [Anabaena cylindrica PCC 7122]MBD2419432.1 PAS domain S-box protein [Anabaena cylindrica FACHB-243]MBY5283867.1 PAS domain S-box protein [Anabaena sp. CCAP 1446/1C]MBY5311641.1 PAS domain S-box protein [Anabaena sp. CCAP 1446/1C]MCM2408945.1 PAS domain S-box protein [Anabaena sp. CCAP 1446/1C]